MSEEKCGTCKWWGSEAITIYGKKYQAYRECLKAKRDGCEMYSIADAECDEDINGWEAIDHDQTGYR